MKRLPAACLTLLILIGCARHAWHSSSSPRPPVAQKIPRVQLLHDERLVDNYFWLREKTNPAVVAYLEAENAYCDAVTKPTESLQEELYREFLSHIKETDLDVPYPKANYFYYSRTEKGKQYAIHCRKKGALEAPEEITLDLNELAKKEKYLALGAYAVSDHGHFLAHSLDRTGFAEFTLHIKDLRTGQLLPHQVDNVASVAWAADNQTLFYTVMDHAKRPYQLYKHPLGAPHDELIYEEKDERFRVWVSRSRSGAFLFLNVRSLTSSEVRFLPASRPDAPWQMIAARSPALEYDVDHHTESFFIRANDKGRNFRLVKAPLHDPQPQNWQEILPHRPNVMLERVLLFTNHCVLMEREDALPHVRVIDLRKDEVHRVKFPEPVYTVAPENNHEFATGTFRYNYESLITPESVFDYHLDRREAKLLKQTEVSGYEPAPYQSQRLHAIASDSWQTAIRPCTRFLRPL